MPHRQQGSRKQGAQYNFHMTQEDRDAIVDASNTLSQDGHRVSYIAVVNRLLYKLAADVDEHPVTAQERLDLPEVTQKHPLIGGIVPSDLIESIPLLVKIAGVPGANSLVMLARRRYLEPGADPASLPS